MPPGKRGGAARRGGTFEHQYPGAGGGRADRRATAGDAETNHRYIDVIRPGRHGLRTNGGGYVGAHWRRSSSSLRPPQAGGTPTASSPARLIGAAPRHRFVPRKRAVPPLHRRRRGSLAPLMSALAPPLASANAASSPWCRPGPQSRKSHYRYSLHEPTILTRRASLRDSSTRYSRRHRGLAQTATGVVRKADIAHPNPLPDA
ncbi:Uncharacterised protein [Mycobacterium tuberculosis]|nr:Uncharacterised protein [Mycobacterium tuberculosis]CRD22232.1 Uncharacterised protein [Mycobacterium tuberculosis]